MTHEFSKESIVPLCVDLDGTLIHTDVLWEGIKFLLRRKPLALLWMLPSLRGGRAPFKKAVSAKSTVSVDSLPWRESLVSWLRSEAAAVDRSIWSPQLTPPMRKLFASVLGFLPGRFRVTAL